MSGRTDASTHAHARILANASTGDHLLFERLSRINHSCSPNMAREYDGDSAFLFALKDVQKGEELTISYLSDAALEMSADKRRAELKAKFNFWCACDWCGMDSTANRGSKPKAQHASSWEQLSSPRWQKGVLKFTTSKQHH